MNADRAHEALPVPIEPVIVTLRGEKVILDSDLAAIYGVKTGVLNRAVKRHRKRFPEDFIFQLSAEEVAALRCQSGTSKRGPIRGHSGLGRGGRRYRPYAFSEHGAIMAATVLSSQRAVQMSVFVVRAFVRLRQLAGMNRAMAEKLAELERRVSSHDEAIRSLVQTIRQLMAPPERSRRSIGLVASPVERVSRRGGAARLWETATERNKGLTPLPLSLSEIAVARRLRAAAGWAGSEKPNRGMSRSYDRKGVRDVFYECQEHRGTQRSFRLGGHGCLEYNRREEVGRMIYRVALRASEEGYSASVPGLPGCWSQGVTEVEALENIREAIREYLAVAAELTQGAEMREVDVAV